jgi:uncharacterized protein (DUF924 family)
MGEDRMTPEIITAYWIVQIGPKGWYAGTPALDAQIRQRFAAAWEAARDGHFADWVATPQGALALLILTDQFPRNMFREDARGFATDAIALRVADAGIAAGHDLATPPPARQFFYLPFMHAEDAALQARATALFSERMPGENLRHARAHAAVIDRFGRFPWRNEVLGRATTATEEAFLAQGGYGAALREIAAIDASGKIV